MGASYNVVEIILAVLILYSISFLLVRLKKIKLITHRRIWNSLLAIVFLISGILGIIIAIQIDTKTILPGYSRMLWFHVEAGIIMAVISVFHIVWHINYYKIIFKLIFKKDEKT
jgi:preprotein translocase subunit YajC